jgi:hypothetical protein
MTLKLLKDALSVECHMQQIAAKISLQWTTFGYLAELPRGVYNF